MQKKKYLAVGSNSEELTEFLLNYWSSSYCHLDALRNKVLYFSCGDQGFKIDVHNDLIRKNIVDEYVLLQEELPIPRRS